MCYRDTIDKLARLHGAMLRIVLQLRENRELGFEKTEKLFYYMQKLEEIKLLEEQLVHASQKLRNAEARAYTHYSEIFTRWRNDLRWLSDQRRKRRHSNDAGAPETKGQTIL